MKQQRDKKTETGSSRSKLAGTSPARSREAGYHLAPSRVPLADDEDVHGSLLDASERISLRSYDSKTEEQGHSNNVQETSYILDERPPVEGRDSVSKEKVDSKSNVNDGLQTASYVPAARSNIATIRELQRCERPKVEPLPLSQNVDRTNVSSPGSHDVSPFTKTQLFSDDKIDSPLSDVVADDLDVDLEYDDYMPQLPGSYFAMDPHAYTLTWSKQPSSWTHQPDVSSRTGSDASVDRQTADS